MWNANFGKARAILLAALVVSIVGCDRAAVPPPPPVAGITPEAQPPNARYRMDPARNRMWVLTHDGVFLYDTTTPRMIAQVQLPSWQEMDARYTCLADLALGPRGEVLITSNIVPTLWRIDPETLAVSVHELVLDADQDKDVGFSGLAYSAEHKVFFAVSDAHGSLWRIDPLLRRAQRVQLSEPIRKACGIVVPSRSAQQMRQLCVHTDEGGRTVILAPDQRSASVRAKSYQAPATHVAQGD